MDELDLLSLSRARQLAADGTARAIRVSAALSLGDVARQLGTSAATVLRWERGDRVPHGQLAILYGKLLEQLMRQSAHTFEAGEK
jgi:DNA-binding transcriptional regulator YiaG